VLIDGAQNAFSLATFMFLNTDWLDGKEVKAIVQQTASNIDEEKRSSPLISLPAFHKGLTIYSVKELRQNLHKWLSPPDPSTNHNIAWKLHHEGTSTWFFQGGIFEQWMSLPSLLWVHGKCMPLQPLITYPIPYSCLGSGLGQECALVCSFLLLWPTPTQIMAVPG